LIFFSLARVTSISTAQIVSPAAVARQNIAPYILFDIAKHRGILYKSRSHAHASPFRLSGILTLPDEFVKGRTTPPADRHGNMADAQN
jgi:hypothetical protein